jgi:hypothetical protein
MLWASFMGKNQKNPNRYKTEKGAIEKQPIPRPGTGNIIRRRRGEKDKRFASV